MDRTRVGHCHSIAPVFSFVAECLWRGSVRTLHVRRELVVRYDSHVEWMAPVHVRPMIKDWFVDYVVIDKQSIVLYMPTFRRVQTVCTVLFGNLLSDVAWK